MNETYSIFGYLLAHPGTAAAILLLAAVIAYLAFFLPKTKNPRQLPKVEIPEEDKPQLREMPERFVAMLDRRGAQPAARDAELASWSRKYGELGALLAAQGGDGKKVAELLDRDDFEKAAETLDWMLDSDRARMAERYWMKGRLLDLMLDWEGAAPLYQKAHELAPDNHVYAASLASALNRLGRTAEACAINESYLPNLRKLAQFNPDAYLADLAESLCGLAAHNQAAGRVLDADRHWLEAVSTHRTIAARPGGDPSRLAEALEGASDFLVMARNYGKAEEFLREAITTRRKLAETEPQRHLPRIAADLNALAGALTEARSLHEAEGAALDALEIRRKLMAGNPSFHGPALAATLVTLGNIYRAMDRSAEAEAMYRDAADRYRALAKSNPAAFLPALAATHNNLGSLYSAASRFSDAEISYKRAVEAAAGDPDPESARRLSFTATALNNLGNLYRTAGRRKDAEAHYQKALELRRKLARRNANAYLHEVAATLNNIGSLLMDEKKFDDAANHFREALTIYRRYAEFSPAAFGPLVKIVEKNLEGLPNLH